MALLLTGTIACSNTCSCKTGWTKKSGENGYFCYKRYLIGKKYDAAKEHCQSMDMQFPKIDSIEELETYTKISS